MPNVAEITNILVYLQANNYTIQPYLYTDKKIQQMAKERKQEKREREKEKEGEKGYKDVNLFNLC